MRIDQFKQARADDLRAAAKVIESTFSGGINTSPIYVAAESLRNESPVLKDGTTSERLWGYQIEDLKLPVDTTKHTRPIGVDLNGLELTLNMRLIADFNEWETMNDPLIDLNFHVVVRGVSKNGPHYLCFHIDKYDKTQSAIEPHPIYHLQYASNPNDQESFDYGSTLFLDTPRIMHHPIDFILGLGLLTTNFFPMAFSDFLNDGYFVGLYKRYQERFIKPYSQTLANHWEFNPAAVTWKYSTDLCPLIL